MPIHYPDILDQATPPRPFSYGPREAMLYALGVGYGGDPADGGERDFVYERNLKVAPTMATVIPTQSALSDYGLDLARVLHGEQRLTLHAPLPPSAELFADWRITGAVDKGPGKGALILSETVLRRRGGEKLATLGATIYARGYGGFGGPRDGGLPPHPVPSDRPPDAEVALRTRPDQALLYRLSGDRNPLHADPAFAKAAGFERPILHGLCTYGVACRAVLRAFCDYDPALLRQFDARFSAPVLPGETILTRMWKEAGGVSFEAVAAESGQTVLTNGRAVLAA